ncbi:hypothetical protein NP233_g774 [Leucocoprinus birnbaumii]|uniref:Uncharacterized protein n=1 Tax=Leucocoprinus birnbaumii TaxID=56174 RepID=A0AAD5W179_9AGAR|nr:hypothetical protein NP233_g774 [Leucocoprinus birnbaumii]
MRPVPFSSHHSSSLTRVNRAVLGRRVTVTSAFFSLFPSPPRFISWSLHSQGAPTALGFLGFSSLSLSLSSAQMFPAEDSQSLTLEELTWLSASALIENQHALSESPTPDRDSRALFNAVFGDSQEELDVERDEDNDDPRPHSRRGSPPLPPMSTLPRRAHAPSFASGSASLTPSMAGSSISVTGSSGPPLTPSTPLTPSPSPSPSQSSSTSHQFQPGRQPITPPPTPPRRHLQTPRYLSHINDPYHHPINGAGALTPPSPSPSVSCSTLSSTLSSRQTEWIYRRPKANSSVPQGVNNIANGNGSGSTLLSRHRSTSATASCSSQQVSRSPSIASSSHRIITNTTTTNANVNASDNTTAVNHPSSSAPTTSTTVVPLHGSGSGSSSSSSTRSPSKSKLKQGRLHAAPSSSAAAAASPALGAIGTATSPKPRPSSPIFISSTTQLVDSGSPPVSPTTHGLERSPSLASNVTSKSYTNGGRLVRSPTLNASASSLHLQSSIRVSPLKNRHGRSGGGSVNGGGELGSGSDANSTVVAHVAQQSQPLTTSLTAGTTGLERSFSNTSTTTNRSIGKPIWSALRSSGGLSTTAPKPSSPSGSATTPTSMGATIATARHERERNRILKLKAIPSHGQISLDSSVTPTFVTPPPAVSLPLFAPSSSSAKDTPPRTPARMRHTLSGASTTTVSSFLPQQKDNDRSYQRRDKFASAPPLPVTIVGANANANTRFTSPRTQMTSGLGSATATSMSSTTTPALLHSGVKMSPSLSSSPSPSTSRAVPAETSKSRKRRSSSSSSANHHPSRRDRTSSFTSQISIATATTTQTSATTGTSNSCSSSSSIQSQCQPATPTTTPSPVPVAHIPNNLSSKPVPVPRATAAAAAYNFRRTSSSNSSVMTGSPSYTPPSYHLHGNGGEKKPVSSFIQHQHPPYQHRHQRQSSTSSSVSFNGIGGGGGLSLGLGLGGGSTAAASARSQAYAQLTGTAANMKVAGSLGLGFGLGGGGGGNSTTATTASSSKRRRPSTSPGPGSGSGSETSSIHSNSFGQRYGFGQRQHQQSVVNGGGSASTLMPSPPTAHHHSSRPTRSSLTNHGTPSSMARSASRASTSSPPYAPSHNHASLSKKSILTRTSSMSTKGSACGGTVKSVKFVEIPEVHYRSGCYEHDGNEYIYGFDNGSNGGGGGSAEDDVEEEEEEGEDDEIPAVGARGEGQEGMVLRECMGLDIEAIDMDIDTYLGPPKSPVEEHEEKESKYSFRKLGFGFLSRGRKESRREEDESKDSIVPPPLEKEEKTSSGFGLKRLMGFTARKAPPPPLSLSISAPIPLAPKSPTTTTLVEPSSPLGNKKRSTSPPVSPRKAISGPYVLGSHLPSSRSPPTHSPIPSPSSSFLHQQMTSRSIPTSSSHTSLNRLQAGRQTGPHRSRSLRSTHRTNASLTTVTSLGMNTERPVGPNIAGTRPKGFVVGAGSVLSVDAVPGPLKSAPSYESFRSAKSYGGRSVRSEVGSMKSAKSVGAGSLRSFRTWMNRSVNVGSRGDVGIAVAVAE